jgi:hypothetical protein
MNISFVSGDLSEKLLLTMAQFSSKQWSISQSTTISIIYGSVVTTLEPMVLWSTLILMSASHCSSCQGDQKQWSLGVYSVFWAERVTPHKCMGCSPYFAVAGAHPILPFDIAEATYLQPPPTSVMSLTDLISHQAIALQKRSADVNALYSKVYQA